MTRGPAAALFAAIVVLSCVLAGSAAGAHGSGSAFGQTGEVDADAVLLDVSLDPDGDARWEIRYRVRLSDENETAAFESLAADVEANRSAYVAQFESRIGGTVAAAENATGREMAVRNVTVRTEQQAIPQRYGVLIYGFEWTGFAATDAPRIQAGDAIGGLFLDEATTLTVGWPADHRLVSAVPDPDETGDRSVTWRGPEDFTTDQPRLTVTSAPGPTTTEPGTGGPVDGRSPAGGTLALLALALALAAAVVWWWYRARPAGTPEAGPDDGDGEPPEDLLSNEERVLRLLRQHGGRMKQQRVVEELGWTDAKTSQVVGELREAGELEGFRLGRENVLRLPEEGDEPGHR